MRQDLFRFLLAAILIFGGIKYLSYEMKSTTSHMRQEMKEMAQEVVEESLENHREEFQGDIRDGVRKGVQEGIDEHVERLPSWMFQPQFEEDDE